MRERIGQALLIVVLAGAGASQVRCGGSAEGAGAGPDALERADEGTGEAAGGDSGLEALETATKDHGDDAAADRACADWLGCADASDSGGKETGAEIGWDASGDGDAALTDVPCQEPCPDDDNPCTEPTCDPVTGCGFIPTTGQPCDDGSECTRHDSCLFGTCVGEPVSCDDGNPCSVDSCELQAGCVNVLLDGDACDDGEPCTAAETCMKGQCIGQPADCDDLEVCTEDSCQPGVGCVHVGLNGNPCNDGSVCTSSDHCQAGVCDGNPVDCNDGNPCSDDACDPLDGCVHAPATGPACNDGNKCTDKDQCVAGACLGQATACDDGNPCTLDSCKGLGGCVHTQPAGMPCDDGDACTTQDACYQGGCKGGPPLECDDKNECTSDSCDPALGCVFDPLDDTPCDDQTACTTQDHCATGWCVGSPLVCTDGTPCTDDTCDPAAGCVFVPLAIPCDDNDPCTAGDYCENGACQPGKDPECLAVKRVVLAGDSWSTGLIFPLRDALDDRGYEEVAMTYEWTSIPGSTVEGWLADQQKMLGLFLALDMEPKADILFFTLTGNDYLGACKNGLGLVGPIEWWLILTKIEWDLQTFLGLVRAGRPNLKVVMIGYDYLEFDMMQVLGIVFPGFERIKFNLGLIDLVTRSRNVVSANPGMVYAHNMGVLQYTFGDTFHFPLLCPAPALGFPEYGPGVVPKPGPAPGYNPFPGGWYTYPSPVEHIPDGIHPDYDGFRAIMENSLDQGAAAWIEGKPWP